MGALWSGTKLADIFGSMILLSKHKKGKGELDQMWILMLKWLAEKMKNYLFQKKEFEQEDWSHPPDPQWGPETSE